MPACLESETCAVVFDHSDDADAEQLWEGCAAVCMQGVVEADWAAAPHTQAAGRCLQIIHRAVHELCFDMLCSDCQLLYVWVAEHGRLHKRTREGLCERAIKACTQHALYNTCALVKHLCCKNEKEQQSTNHDGTQEVLEARRKAGSSLAALQALITPQLQDGALSRPCASAAFHQGSQLRMALSRCLPSLFSDKTRKQGF